MLTDVEDRRVFQQSKLGHGVGVGKADSDPCCRSHHLEMWLFTKNHGCAILLASYLVFLIMNRVASLPLVPNLVSLVTAVIPGKWGWAVGGVWAEY